jgi:hypothetical protein
MLFEVHMAMQLCNEGRDNESIKGVLKTFNLWAIAKVMTEILVDFRQIMNEKSKPTKR